MDEEERKRKLEAGKAKLASFRKKKSKKRKREKDGFVTSTPRDASNSEEVGAGDSIAVQTGDDTSFRGLSPSDDTDQSTTTAEEISTEEEPGFSMEMSTVERIQELELTVSDQQIALQKLTLENKELHDMSQVAMLESSINERDSIIGELRESVGQTANQVRYLQQQLTKATEAVKNSGGEQGQIVAELMETHRKLDAYQLAITRQEETLQQMAQKLELKSLEAEQSAEQCRSLQLELEKSHSLLATSEDIVSSKIQSEKSDFEQEKSLLKSELAEIHAKEIETMKQEHETAMEFMMIKQKQMEQAMSSSPSSFDPEDVRALREQSELMRLQLETSYRDMDKLKKDHDKEVIQLNQQLVSVVDDYETKLHEEKRMTEDLEHRLEMSDTVSSEIQSSFSKQLDQLEEERDLLRQQLRQAQSKAKETNASKKQIQDLEEEVVSYQSELAETNNRLEEAEKQRRQLRDEVERTQESLQRMKSENEELKSLHTAALDLEEQLKLMKNEHSEELKNLHSQHHRQMEELKIEMERQMESTRSQLDDEHKEQLGTVKDVHERNHERELHNLQEEHERMLEQIKEDHSNELDAVKLEAREMKSLAEDQLRFELKEQFDSVLENEIADLKRTLEQDHHLMQTESQEKFDEEMEMLNRKHDLELKAALQEQEILNEEALAAQKQELDQAVESMKSQFHIAQQTLEAEHADALAKLESELQSIHDNTEKNDGDLQKEIEELKRKIAESSGLEEDYQEQIRARDVALNEERMRREQERQELEKEVEEIKDELNLVQKERDQIFMQAEESQKRLATLHEQQSTHLQSELHEKEQTYSGQLTSLQQDLAAMKSAFEESQRLLESEKEESGNMKQEVQMLQEKHTGKIEAMQMEIDAHRTSRSDLKDLHSQLLARSAAVEDIEKLREELAQEKEALRLEHQQEIEKIRLEHEEEVNMQQEKLEQVLADLQESRDKVEEMTPTSVILQSSPLRSLSAMSDYDSSNVEALNKDYRSAMTLTNVANVSGLSELEIPQEDAEDQVSDVAEQSDVIEEEELDVIEERELLDAEIEESKEEDDDDHAKMIQQLNEMKTSLEALQEEMDHLKSSHNEALENLVSEHKHECEELQLNMEREYKEMVDNLKLDHEKDTNKALEKQKVDHMHEITQIRLQCASDTAVQIEHEMTALRSKMKEDFNVELDALKHAMELETSEKIELERNSHEKALQDQSDALSSSMENRLSAVMSELHEQKQAALQKLSNSHKEEVANLKDALEKSTRDAEEQENHLRSAVEARENLENETQTIKAELEALQVEYKEKINELKSGDEAMIRDLKLQHKEAMEKLRKSLENQHDERQEHALQKQAAIFQQAQEEFVRLHEEQISRFTSDQREEAEKREEEVQRRIKEEQEKIIRIHEEENEELKVLATRLVEVSGEKQQINEYKDQLVSQLEAFDAQKERDLSELKANLVEQHMLKFQEMTMNLEQHHKEQMEETEARHCEEEGRLRVGLVELQRKIDVMEEDRGVLEELVGRQDGDVEERIKVMEEEHKQKIEAMTDEHEMHLKQIEEELKTQEEAQKSSYQELLAEQNNQIERMKKEFNDATENITTEALAESQKMVARVSELEGELKEMEDLRSKLHEVTHRKDELESAASKMEFLEQATESSVINTQKLMERIADLEEELQSTEVLLEEMDQVRARRDELEAVMEAKDARIQEWEEEREAYEKKLSQISEELSTSQEDYQDLSARIEFERAEYETEIESIQEDVRTKEESLKELEAEVDHKSAALDSLQQQHERLSESRERETQEGDNLLKMLRDDLDRISNERDAINASNEQLLSTLSELVRTNQRCEEIIAQRLQSLPIVGNDNPQTSEASSAQSHASNTDTDTTVTPLNTSLSGSFIDEGLDLSQRLAESMFIGPELDPQAREIVTGSATRVAQSVAQLLDMLYNTLQQRNVAQQAQTMLGNELERLLEAKQKLEDNEVENVHDLNKSHLQDELEEQSSRIQELEHQVSEHEETVKMLQGREDEVRREQQRLEEEKDLIKMQKDALTEDREEAEINLLGKIEELTQERNLLVKKLKHERDQLTDAARQLETVVEQNVKDNEDKETEYLTQIEDLQSQIEALRKQTESGSKFNAELTSDREVERDQFEKEMEALRNEIDQARDTAKSSAILADRVEQLEEEMESKQKTHEREIEAAHTQVEELNKQLQLQIGEINDLKEQAASIDPLKEENLKSLSHLEELKQQHEVLQQEHNDQNLRISALEAQLDRYRHGVDEQMTSAQEQADAEERRIRERGQEQIAEKEQEIEHLVEQQVLLRSQVIEKEEQVNGLLMEVDHYKLVDAENLQLKEELSKARETLPASSETQSEQLEALSRHLLDEKNAEIDDLRQQITVLQSEIGEEGTTAAQQMLAALQSQIQELSEENEELQTQLRSTEEQLDQALEKLEELTASEPEVVEQKSTSRDEDDGDTGIHEVDLTVGELTRQEDANCIHDLMEENNRLRDDVEAAHKRAEEVLSQATKDVFNIPSTTKEKIRDLEEHLEKEKDATDERLRSSTSSDNSSMEDEAHDGTFDKKLKTKDTNILREKLLEIEEELKEHPHSVIGMILREKDADARSKLDIVEQLETQLVEKNANVEELEQQVSKLERDLNEPDVRIKMNEDAASDADAIEVEQEQAFNIPTIEIQPDSDTRSQSSDAKSKSSHSSDAKSKSSHSSDAKSRSSSSSDSEQHSDTENEQSDAQSESSQSSVASSKCDEKEMIETTPDEENLMEVDGEDKLQELKEEIQYKNVMIEKHEELITEKESNIEQLTEQLVTSDAKLKHLEEEMNNKCKELVQELEELRSSQEVDPAHADVEEELNRIKDELVDANGRIETLQNDRDVASKKLMDVEEEFKLLMEENNRLESEARGVDEQREEQITRIHNLEDVVQEREVELQQAQQEADGLQMQVQDTNKYLLELEDHLKQNQEARKELEEELRTLLVEHQDEVDQLQNQISLASQQNIDEKADIEKQLAEHENESTKWKGQSEEQAVEINRITSLNQSLREEIQTLNFKIEELEIEMQNMEQTHKNETEGLVADHASNMATLEAELSTQHVVVEEPLLINSPTLQSESMQSASDRMMSRSSSLESKSSDEVHNVVDDLRAEHHKKMEEMQRKYAIELEEAVAAARKEQKDRDEAHIRDVEEKHRRDMAEVLYESLNGDTEIACRLRAELDLADQLDNKLINQLTGAVDGTDEDQSSTTSSPSKETEISSKLQHLLSRLHNEGVQVLTLSELQFIKHHQGRNSLSTSVVSEPEVVEKPSMDIDGLKQAWQNEKLALLDAIQALKELLTQTASEAAQQSDDEGSLKWRSDLLKAVAELFEREKRALLAELRANVIEAQNDAENAGENGAASRLETLERRIRNQADNHRSELERLLAADRDQLMEEVKQLKEDRKELNSKAQSRTQELQEQLKSVEDQSRHTQSKLQREVERLSSQLQHEQAMINDLQSSLDAEQQRSNELLPTLERERDRIVELSAEIESLSSKARSDTMAANQHVQSLQNDLREAKTALEKSENEVRNLEKQVRGKEEEVRNEREKQEEEKVKEEEAFAELRAALCTEENRRREAVSAVEIERHNVSKLHHELAAQRATAYDDVLQLKNRCDELSAAVDEEQARNDDLRCELDHKVLEAQRTQEELEHERKTTLEAREHDRATVADLQSILEEAKSETERVQRRVDDAEAEKDAAIQRAREEQLALTRRLEQNRSTMEDALLRERQVRNELQFALDTEKHRKQEAQQRIRELEDQRRDSLRRQEEERLLPRSPRESNEALLAQRRQLESLRQRLQLEATKLQRLVDKTSHRPSPRDYSSTDSHSTSLLSTDGERVESLKRALDDMQGELKDLYATLTLPERNTGLRPSVSEFNDRLLQENALLADQAASGAREARELRDVIEKLREENQRPRSAASDASENVQHNQQKMATRMHKLYTRYLRAESFRKSLVYQKKYLILLLGGFQDCEEATLALIARMGAYPSTDSMRRPIVHHSSAYTKFRSAVRAVIAVCRLKFLVRKWKRASTTVSTAIQNKHGVAVDVQVNGVNPHGSRHHRADRPTSPYLSRTPSPRPIESHDSRSHDRPITRHEPPTHDISPYHRGIHTSPYSRPQAYRSSYERDLGVSAANSRRLSPAAAAAYASLDRSGPVESDPSLNEYIRKLENLQRKLGQGTSPRRYPV